MQVSRETISSLCFPCTNGWNCSASRYKKRKSVRRFAVTPLLSDLSQPKVYESHIAEKKIVKQEVMTTRGMQPWYDYVHTRWWETSDGIVLSDEMLKRVQWKWTGHYSTYIGKQKRRKRPQ